MHPPEYNGNIALAEVLGDLVSAGGKGRHASNADQVHVRIPRDVLDLLVDDLNDGVFGTFGRHRQQAQHRKAKSLATAKTATPDVTPFAAGRCYQENLHRTVLLVLGGTWH